MNDFKILTKVKWFIEYVNIYAFSSFPKKNLGLKIRIEENMYLMLENIMRANINVGNIRSKYQKEVLLNISMLDYYIGFLFDKKIIKKRRFLSCVNALNGIRKMIYGWIGNEKEE